MGLWDFLTANRETKQQRTRDLNDRLEGLLNYSLGPTGIPDKLYSLNEMLNPIAQIGQAGADTVVAFDPERSPEERRQAAINAVIGTITAAAPAIAGKLAGQGAGQAVMETLANVTGPMDDAATRFIADESGAIRVWHGSPHDFDRFSLDKIGTGEGAQAYGHGLYFAENEGVARGYRDQLTDMDVGSAVRALDKAGGDVDAAIVETQRKLDNLLSLPNRGNDDFTWRNQVNIQEAKLRNLRGYKEAGDWPSGRLYEVNIDANPEDFLDWDRPLSEQPQAVRDAIEGVSKETSPFLDLDWASALGIQAPKPPVDAGLRGVDAYTNAMGLNTAEETAKRLREAGIPGIRYLDAGSRGAGDGSRNYVVFDDRLVDILSKDGAKTPEGHAQEVLGLLSSGRANEVTDAMLDLGDPVANTRLNQYLFNNYDLPMDEASRMARAGEMGFDTGKTWYHGTPDNRGLNAEGFKTRYEAMYPERQRKGPYFLTDNARVASTYADDTRAFDYQGAEPEVMSLYSRADAPLEINARGNQFRGIEQDYLEQALAERHGADSPLMDNLRLRLERFRRSDSDGRLSTDSLSAITKDFGSHDTVDVRNVLDTYTGSGPTSTVRMFRDPTEVRRTTARFDPRLAHLSNLNAALGGLAVGGGLLNQYQDDQWRERLGLLDY